MLNHFPTQSVNFDSRLLTKYDRPLPRYTSYPPATELTPEFDEVNFRAALAVGNYRKIPLSLYCHIPFCETACYFCGCNTIITKQKKIADPYLDYLMRDIERIASLVDKNRRVDQLHWGGGTPNYLSLEQIDRLWNSLTDHFSLAEDAEISIEVNPRYLDKEYVRFLRQTGFNRISFGIQDFDERVQTAINRVQPESLLFNVMDWIRGETFESVNVDLIYGLPHQNLATFRETVRKTIDLDPDRIAVFNFAYIPGLKPAQKNLDVNAFPSPSEKLAILQMTIEELTNNGYVYIGMDHFAKPNDELAIAQREGELHRNFQGYTTKPESDLIGFGVTSISMLDDVYIQNQKGLKDYYRSIEDGKLPIERGVSLTGDDRVRRAAIMELMCQFRLSKQALLEKYHLAFDSDFEEYFATEIPELRALEADGLLDIVPDGIEVTPAGRLLIRNIAAVFDAYRERRQTATFSRSI
ncbi:oxygen-independent coproporphyrinogen III oxidase [Pannus brasiliensis CCIBt3594]|uniref:Coproporphyrinogen-III oxidase n=1 Tax=Pannus brasiliensis CCIBt3594 TaxID=1427578 RepID=A0AAW9QWK6_9CHRO